MIVKQYEHRVGDELNHKTAQKEVWKLKIIEVTRNRGWQSLKI